jgi:3-deoxy-D-manno-octulosonic-acid transferase
MIGRLGYNLGVRSYTLGVRIVSLWNPKAKLWLKGRKNLKNQLLDFQPNSDPIYWFHCASLGEFEQGRPLIERLKAEENCQIVLTFFSPSGYEVRKNYPLADAVFYLPVDTKRNAEFFLNAIRPSAVYFVKYEFWANFIFAIRKRQIPLYSVSAIFRKKQLFFKKQGAFMRQVLKCFTLIFVQDQQSYQLLLSIDCPSILAGDTRYDRVISNAEKVQRYPDIEQFIGQEKVLVVGSSWTPDEENIATLFAASWFNWKVIIAPHEIHENHLNEIIQRFGNDLIRYSNISNFSNEKVLLIDNIGMLMNVYQYADIAYVGGAFGRGLHNILEPASFDVPVFFGPRYAKFKEAADFVANGIGFSIDSSDQLLKQFKEVMYMDLSEKVSAFMQSKKGATEIITSTVKRQKFTS